MEPGLESKSCKQVLYNCFTCFDLAKTMKKTYDKACGIISHYQKELDTARQELAGIDILDMPDMTWQLVFLIYKLIDAFAS